MLNNALIRQALSDILDSLDTGVLVYEAASGLIHGANQAAARLFEYPVEALCELRFAELHLEADTAAAFASMAAVELLDNPQFFTEWPLVRRNGRHFPAEIRIRPVLIEGQAFNLAAIKDLTRQHEYEDSLALAQQVLDNASEAVMITDAANQVVRVNSAFTRITGWSAEESIGRNPSFLSSGKQGPDFYREMWKSLSESGVWQGEVINRRRSGQYFPEWLSISTVRNRQGRVTHYLAIFSDISERKRAEGLIHRYSWFDSLTDLPNKALLIDRINQAVIAAQNEGKPLYILALNLNRLKHINDSLGHSTGDEVLKVVAQRLVQATREGDTVSRIAGDDFVVVVPRLSQPHRALNLAERLLDAINLPIDIQGNLIHITANAGISVFPNDGGEPETLLMNADAALNHSRTQGQNKTAFFEPHMNAEIIRKLSLQTELSAALVHGQFQLHFQPQVDLGNGRLSGLEALIRWQHPECGQISPVNFIPAAEELGLIVQIGEWVINEACRSLAHWRQVGHTELSVAVNLSPHQFAHANLVDSVRNAIARHAIPPACLELEITEGVAMHDVNEVLIRLHALKEIGVKISIDDFGTGYSSLAYLMRFPVDKLKIDQSFVRDMGDSSEAGSIVRAIVALAHGLSLSVIAEGVESALQRDNLAALGCNEIQGYLLSRPLPFGEISDWMQAYQTR